MGAVRTTTIITSDPSFYETFFPSLYNEYLDMIWSDWISS